MNPGIIMAHVPFAEYVTLFTVGMLLIGLVIWKGSRHG